MNIRQARKIVRKTLSLPIAELRTTDYISSGAKAWTIVRRRKRRNLKKVNPKYDREIFIGMGLL